MASVQQSQAVLEVQALTQKLAKDQTFIQKTYPVNANWASQLGHPCERYLFHNRRDWEHKRPRDWKGVGIRGNLIADWWKRYMSEKGYQITQAERPLSKEIRDKYQISGRIDGRIGLPGISTPRLFEFKTCQPFEFDKINCYEDIAESKKDYIRGYIGQIQIYLLDMDEEAGLFILCNASTLEWKPIIVYLDYSYSEYLLKRAERVNLALFQDKPPQRIPYGKTCQKCDYQHICLPDIKNDGLEMVDQDYLVKILHEAAQLKNAADEYDAKISEAKDIAREIGKDCIVGSDFKIELKTIKTRRVDVNLLPIEVRSQYEVDAVQTRVEFIPINSQA